METNFNTLESAQAEIIRLNDLVTELTTARDTLTENNNTLTADNEELRKLNQSYFNKLIMQFDPAMHDNHKEPEEVKSLEEIALELLSDI